MEEKEMPKKRGKSILERAFVAILGAFLAYLSGSASGLLQIILLIAGIAIVLYAILSD